MSPALAVSGAQRPAHTGARSHARPLAVITGGSGGIGARLAKEFASRGFDLLLVARDEQALARQAETISREFGVAASTFAADLSSATGVDNLVEHMNSLGTLDVFVNNAGFGDYGAFLERPGDTYREMINLNVLALTRLTHVVAALMVRQGRGHILQVASTAGFQPGPGFAVYSATKAYVISLSEALHQELRGTQVTCTILSPGPTHTGFASRATMRNSALFTSGVMDPGEVAQLGAAAALAGKLHVVPGLKNRLLARLSMLTPSRRMRLSLSAYFLRSH